MVTKGMSDQGISPKGVVTTGIPTQGMATKGIRNKGAVTKGRHTCDGQQHHDYDDDDHQGRIRVLLPRGMDGLVTNQKWNEGYILE